MDDLTRLLVAARDGDDGALAAAIRKAQPDVWRLVAHLVGRQDADDVTQETFLRAYRALPAFRAEASARTWLLSIARRAAADAIRSARRRRRISARAEAEAAVATPSSADRSGITDLVTRLDPERREAFVLTQVVGCSYAEAAEVCGVPVGTIRSRVARARAELVEQVRAADTA
ncbi:MAG: sigma-70 family RNA polymerase sigma factor [Actinobacteria bacterium]|nr:sigma-70 family RNA polymerase sigma factor [Actinomycetota bacterium]